MSQLRQLSLLLRKTYKAQNKVGFCRSLTESKERKYLALKHGLSLQMCLLSMKQLTIRNNSHKYEHYHAPDGIPHHIRAPDLGELDLGSITV